MLGTARARTEAPGTVGAFLRQRRRWFGGFLQTQYWYRDMVGDPRHGWLGLAMLPVKAIDTLQPLYGLTAFFLLVYYLLNGSLGVLAPVGGVIGAKIVLDLVFHLWSVHLYRCWALGAGGRRAPCWVWAGPAGGAGGAVYLPDPAAPGCGLGLGLLFDGWTALGPPKPGRLAAPGLRAVWGGGEPVRVHLSQPAGVQGTGLSTVNCSTSTRRLGSRHLIKAGSLLSLHSTTGLASPRPWALKRVLLTPLPVK